MSVRKLIVIVAGVFCLFACTSIEKVSTTDTEDTESTGFGIAFEKYTLDNGLDVILHVDKSDPMVAVSSLFHVGSSREEKGRTGFAHFFEHMSFNDSENVPRGANRKYIAELGGTRNGGTSFDYTQYYEVVPKDALEKIFWIDSDRMGYMINTVTEEALEREKQVVKNEKRQRVDNAPYGHTYSVILKALYPKSHPYSWSVIGSLEDLQNATLDDVTAFYDRWYGANNATLVVAGDFEPAVIKRQIQQWFGEMRRGPQVEPMQPMPVKLTESKNLWYPDNFAKLPAFTRVYPSIEQYHPDSYALNVLAQLLAGSKSAPLYETVVLEGKLAANVSMYNASRELAGQLVIGVRALEGKALDDVQAAVEEGLDRFATEGFDSTELLRIKAELETDFYQGVSGVLSKAQVLATYNEFAGDPGFVSEDIRRIQAVTRADVMRVFNQYVRGQHFVQTSFVPKNAPELAVSGSQLAQVVEEEIVQGAEAEVSQGALAEYEKTPSKHDRSEPPLGPAPIFRSPDIWDADLANGIKVTGIFDNETPLVSFSLTVPGGEWQDIPGREGAASLLAALSMQGTASKTPAELEQAIGLLGASISFGSSAESFSISGVTLDRNLNETVALLEEMLLQPRWDESEFERLRRSRLASIIAAQGNASSLARNAFNALLFGRDHPYGKPGIGIGESIEALTIDDLKAWHAANLSPAGATLQIVGAVDKAQALAAFSRLAKNWEGEQPASKTYPMGPPPKGETVYFIDLPGAKQSVIRVGKRIMPVTDPEWLRLNYANQRLGSGSSARLTQLLRIEKGYTYGAGSGLGGYLNGPSPWLATTSVRANVTLESMQLIREQIQAYAATFLDEDTEVTKNQTIKRNARSLETLGAKRGLLSRIAQRGAPYNIVELETQVLQSMTTQDFRQAIDRNLNESEMIWVVVGDAETQLERLKEFGYGDVIMLDRQGNPLPTG